jgi:hypothetical protein
MEIGMRLKFRSDIKMKVEKTSQRKINSFKITIILSSLVTSLHLMSQVILRQEFAWLWNMQKA